MSTTQPINFGVLGCAGIARKISRAVNLCPISTLHSVGSRSIEKAQQFSQSNNFPPTAKHYGRYEDVLNNPDVDAVYIPLPTSLHLKWAVAAARKKKHVLLEKPAALNVGQLDEILNACEDNGVQFMDGTMWMHHPRTQIMKGFLDDPDSFGHLKTMHTNFSFAADSDFLENDIRVKPELDALGALGDVGWYCIRASLWAANYELPKFVIAHTNPLKNKSGVLLSCGATLHWEDGKVGTFDCSFMSNMTMDLTAIGTKGTLYVNDFVIPYAENAASYSTSSETKCIDMELGWNKMPSKHIVNNDLPQEAHMVKEFSALVESIKHHGASPDMKWPTRSRKTQLVIDAVIASIERGFQPVDVC